MKDKTIFIKWSTQDKLPEGEWFIRLLVWNKKDGDIEIWEDYTPTNMDDKELLISHYSHWSDGEEIPLSKILEEVMPTEKEVNIYFQGNQSSEPFKIFYNWILGKIKSKLTT